MTWVTESKMTAIESIPRIVRDTIENLIAETKNGIISGEEGSGKVTIVKELFDAIPEENRVLVLEQPVKMRTLGPNIVKMERQGRPLDSTATTEILELARELQPEHTLVGYIRNSLDYRLLLTLNAEHGGTLSTVHATSASQALDHLRTLAKSPHPSTAFDDGGSEVADAVDFVLHCKRDLLGRKKIAELLMVDGYNDSLKSFQTITLYRAW